MNAWRSLLEFFLMAQHWISKLRTHPSPFPFKNFQFFWKDFMRCLFFLSFFFSNWLLYTQNKNKKQKTIHKRKKALGKTDQLPVVFHEVAESDRRSLNSLKVLTQPLRLKLVKSEDEKEPLLKDYSENVILIEPLADIRTLEQTVLPKIADPSLIRFSFFLSCFIFQGRKEKQKN